jgi:hypothetical protein
VLPPAVAEIHRCAVEMDPADDDRVERSCGRLRLIVTHDDVIAFTLAILLGRETVSDEDLPWMLEGFFLWNEGGRTVLLWREQRSLLAGEVFALTG